MSERRCQRYTACDTCSPFNTRCTVPAHAFGPSIGEPSLYPISDHGPFELSEHAHHLKQCPAFLRSRVDGLLMQVSTAL